MVNMFDIFYADLSEENKNSSIQNGKRPVVIIQNDIGNKYSPTVIVVPITSEIKKLNQPTHCIIHRSKENGLKRDSMVLAEQVRVIDKERLLNKIGKIDNEKEKNAILNAYLANITGKNKDDSILSKVIDTFLNLIREGNMRNAACR